MVAEICRFWIHLKNIIDTYKYKMHRDVTGKKRIEFNGTVFEKRRRSRKT